jgi:hypothetical protein
MGGMVAVVTDFLATDAGVGAMIGAGVGIASGGGITGALEGGLLGGVGGSLVGAASGAGGLTTEGMFAAQETAPGLLAEDLAGWGGTASQVGQVGSAVAEAGFGDMSMQSFASTALGGGEAWLGGAAAASAGAGGGLAQTWNTFKGTGLGKALSVGSDINTLMQAEQLKKQGKAAQAASDPFSPYRAQYAQQLAQLQANPGSITSLPGYEAGNQALMRSLSARGLQGSGNAMVELQKYGQDFYAQQVNQLAGLAGAGATPGAGSGTAINANMAANKAQSSAFADLAKMF